MALLRQQLKTPAPPPPPEDLASIGAEALKRLEVPLKDAWPAAAGELLSYELGFTPEGLLVRIHYRNVKPLDPTAQEILAKVLKSQLNVDKLRLDLEQEKPPPPPQKVRSRTGGGVH